MRSVIARGACVLWCMVAAGWLVDTDRLGPQLNRRHGRTVHSAAVRSKLVFPANTTTQARVATSHNLKFLSFDPLASRPSTRAASARTASACPATAAAATWRTQRRRQAG